MCKCAICNEEISPEQPVIYDGEECHYDCAFNDIDSIGMDQDFE